MYDTMLIVRMIYTYMNREIEEEEYEERRKKKKKKKKLI